MGTVGVPVAGMVWKVSSVRGPSQMVCGWRSQGYEVDGEVDGNFLACSRYIPWGYHDHPTAHAIDAELEDVLIKQWEVFSQGQHHSIPRRIHTSEVKSPHLTPCDTRTPASHTRASAPSDPRARATGEIPPTLDHTRNARKPPGKAPARGKHPIPV